MRGLCSRRTTLNSSLHDQLNLPFVVLNSFTKTVKGRTVPNPTDVNNHSFTTMALLLIWKIACSNQFSNDLMSMSNGLSLTTISRTFFRSTSPVIVPRITEWRRRAGKQWRWPRSRTCCRARTDTTIAPRCCPLRTGRRTWVYLTKLLLQLCQYKTKNGCFPSSKNKQKRFVV